MANHLNIWLQVSFIDRVSRFDFELEGKVQNEKHMEFFKRWDDDVPVPGIGKGKVRHRNVIAAGLKPHHGL